MKNRSLAAAPSTLAAAILILASGACAGRQTKFGRGDAKFDLAGPYARAVEVEQMQGSEAAMRAYLELLDRSLANSASPYAPSALLASVDALVTRSAPSLDKIGNAHGLAFRHPGGMKTVLDRLTDAYAAASGSGPFARGVVARGALELALHEGNAPLAQTWRQRTGCARAATVVGPLDWAPITAMTRETPLEAPTKPLEASYRGVGPFVENVPPLTVPADGCEIGLMTTSILEGLRAVVV
ncbi:MAG TPA: hypothetical protein VF881_01890, partial [Polyangiaceae bacterium]